MIVSAQECHKYESRKSPEILPIGKGGAWKLPRWFKFLKIYRETARCLYSCWSEDAKMQSFFKNNMNPIIMRFETAAPQWTKLLLVNLDFFMCHIYWSRTEKRSVLYTDKHVPWFPQDCCSKMTRLLVEKWRGNWPTMFHISCYIKA